MILENFWIIYLKIEELKGLVKLAGLWNLFLFKEYGDFSFGFFNLEYVLLVEEMGCCKWVLEIFNCSVFDIGNMEVLVKYGN